ncbi:CBS domain-containing protein [Nesterenkonia sp. CF4.4]|uniref:CBS domain-containing protein n=1 Tax=Nesterenkonia sp. CF4.4 TaxID=3373079 RepID=UPI003EE73976
MSTPENPSPDRSGPPRILSAEQNLGSVLAALGPEVFASEDIAMARQRLRQGGVEHLVVTDAAGRSVGFLTRADLDLLDRIPGVSSSTPCADLIATSVPSLHPEDSFDAAIATLQIHGVRPLLVCEDEELIGVLEPTTVIQWCAQHRPNALEELVARPTAEVFRTLASTQPHRPDTYASG